MSNNPHDHTNHFTPLRLQALYEVSHKINSLLELDKLLDEIMDFSISLLEAEKGLVLLKDDQSEKMAVKVARGLDKNTLNDAVAMSRTVIDRVEKGGQSVLLEKVPDVSGGDATRSMIQHRLKSIICVPLFLNRALVGAIYLDTTAKEHFFKPADVPYLEAFANLAGIAIANARQYEEIQALNTSLEKKVAQRTDELRQKNDELSRANKDLRDAQLQLIQSEKMASLGQLAAGVAHEINTPLGSLNSNMDMFIRGFGKISRQLAEKDDAAAEIAKTLEVLANLATVSKSACDRISHIVKALSNFARLDEEGYKPVDLHEGLESMLVLSENDYRDRIEIQKAYGELPALSCRAGQLNQAFMNVFRNACEAIEEKGWVKIETILKDNAIHINFADNGRGISESNLPRIFDPGFTTKGVGVGVGLGLSISYKIVEDHGGDIRVDSRDGQGATVTITLPVKSA